MSDGATRHDNGAATATGDVATFVEGFDAAWRAGAEGLRGFEALITPDVLLTQPLLPTAHGPAAFRAQFDTLFAAIPDLRGEVLSWGASADGVLIDLRLRGTLGGRPVELITCDRIVLRDGLMAERHARMDPLPLVRAALASPAAALPMLRSLLAGARGDDGGQRPEPGAAALAGRVPGGTGTEPVARPLVALAIGRLVLGASSRLAPQATARAFGAADPGSPELAYMSRIFGARAIALGSGYLLSDGEARRRWQRIALGVDVSDTLAGLGQLRRNDVPRRSALAVTALTGTYAAVGAWRLVRDLRGAG
jgi:hypothetical protein